MTSLNFLSPKFETMKAKILSSIALVLVCLFVSTDLFSQKEPPCFPCKKNLIKNPGFTLATGTGGNMTNTSHPGWKIAYGSPNYSMAAGIGFLDNGFMNMWGNKIVGEGLIQKLVTPLQAGRSYRLSFAIESHQVKKRPNYVRYKVRFSNTPITSATQSAPVEIYTPYVYVGEGWVHVSLPIFTASANYQYITFSPVNDLAINHGEKTSVGKIDNICLREVRGVKRKLTAKPISLRK